MTSIAYAPVRIQTSSQAAPTPPPWFGEVTLICHHLTRQGVLAALAEQVRFARRRFERYEVLDFLAVLLGSAISGERTLEAFYQRLHPFAAVFMGLFGRDRLPARSTLSRFLGALTPEPVEALRTLFLADLLARKLPNEAEPGGLWDRQGSRWLVFDVDGTREAGRQRAVPQTPDRPAAQRRLRPLCAPGYTGRKRGEVVRTRTTVLQAHSHQWLGSFGHAGNGEYRAELRQGVVAIGRYRQAHDLPAARVVLRLDGQYGTGAVLADLVGFSFVVRGKADQVLDRPEIQVRLHLPADGQFTRPESPLCRTLYDCPQVPCGPSGVGCRVGVATHPAGKTKSRVGVEREGVVYELFFTNLPQSGFTAADVLALYLHRGAFEPTLADEDQEQDPDRWGSHSPWGQECWQVLSQWVWNLRLELGHHLEPTPLRTTEFRAALLPVKARTAPARGYAPAQVALPFKHGRFSGQDFVLHPDGALRCPAGQALSATETRTEDDGSLRLVYAARLRQCRSCRWREPCQWKGQQTTKPRRVSVLLHPLTVGPAPLLGRDGSRRQHRRACRQLLRDQRVEVQLSLASQVAPAVGPPILSRAQRAHSRLSWGERQTRNACAPTLGRLTLFGVPDAFAAFLGLPTRRERPRARDRMTLCSEGAPLPSVPCCLLCLAVPRFLSAFAIFAASPAVSATAPPQPSGFVRLSPL
jgi:hypothetical protein